MPRTPNLPARPGFFSVFTTTTAALPARVSATFRTTGANETQWGHQGAQNSARIGAS